MDDNTYFRSKIAYDVWAKKYKADSDNTPADTLKRCNGEFRKAENQWVERINRLLRKRSVRSKLSPTFGRVMLRDGRYGTEWMDGMFSDFSHLMLGGSLVSGLGTKHLASLSNCFVIGSPADNLSGINSSVNEMENVFSHRGGVGLDLSTLRPQGAPIHNAARISEGVVSVMKHKYGESAKYIAQNGRRGALMLMLDVMHPDALEFIKCKRDNVSVTTANISVKLNGEFMQLVMGGREEGAGDAMLVQRFPIDAELGEGDIELITNRLESGEYEAEKLYEYNGIYIKCVSAMKIWDELVAGARDWAEPGCLFWDNVVSRDPASRWDDLRPIATNPCGEQPLTAGDTCRLMHYNLNTFVKERFSAGAYIDYDEMFDTFYKVMWLGDDVIELEVEAIGRIISKLEGEGDGGSPMADFWRNVQNVAQFGRRVGIGISGLGDMYASLGVPYGEPEVTKKVFSTMLEALLTASTDLAVLKGEAPCFYDDDIKPLFGFGFRNFVRSLVERCVRFNTADDMKPRDEWEEFVSGEFPELWKRMRAVGRRNVSVNTVAPTGTVSLLAGITSGIEPLFMGWYRRKVKLDDNATEYDEIDQTGNKFKYYNILHEGFEDWIAYAHPDIDREKLTDEELDTLFMASPYYLQSAHDISWERRVLTQAIVQKYITSSISSTVNLPNDTTVEVVDDLFRTAYKSGCKGITVYRDGSREGVLVKKETQKADTDTLKDVNAVRREKSLQCDVFHFYNGKEKWVAFVGIQNDRPYEIFTGLEEKLPTLPPKVTAGNIVRYKRDGASCYDFEYYTEDGGKQVVESINKTFDPEFWNYGKLLSAMLRHRMPLVYIVKTLGDMRFENDSINSWRTGVVRALKKWIKDGTKLGEKCPECGETLVMENGCRRCPSCGWSACG